VWEPAAERKRRSWGVPWGFRGVHRTFTVASPAGHREPVFVIVQPPVGYSLIMEWFRGDNGGGRELKGHVEQCLRDLGDTPAGVADRLGGLKVRGIPGRADECAVARYLKAVIGSERSVKVVGVLERRVRISRRGMRPPVSVMLPAEVAEFVRGFDQGQFPVLVEPTFSREPSDRHPAS
jgi:hypothetical protein